MSEFDDLASGETLDDYLVSLAEGVSAAQRKLSDPAFSGAGLQGGVTYQIPYLDFELKLHMSSSIENSDASGATSRSPGKRRKMLVSKPQTKEEFEAVSILRGRLVAVPVNAGQPGFRLDMNFKETGAREVEVLVRLSDTSGSPQAGVDVELNIDRDLSNELNRKEGRSTELNSGTGIEQPLVKTDLDGIAKGRLRVHSAEPIGHIIVITADALKETISLSYRVSA